MSTLRMEPDNHIEVKHGHIPSWGLFCKRQHQIPPIQSLPTGLASKPAQADLLAGPEVHLSVKEYQIINCTEEEPVPLMMANVLKMPFGKVNHYTDVKSPQVSCSGPIEMTGHL